MSKYKLIISIIILSIMAINMNAKDFKGIPKTKTIKEGDGQIIGTLDSDEYIKIDPDGNYEYIIELKSPVILLNNPDKQLILELISKNKAEHEMLFSDLLSIVQDLNQSNKNNKIFVNRIKDFKYSINAIAVKTNEKVIERIKNNPLVKKVHKSVEVKTCDDVSNNIIGADSTWLNYGVSGVGKIISIIDTGIDTNHTALNNGKVIGGYNFWSNNTNYLDDNGHGTHCAGIAAGNNTTIKGVAFNARLYAVKVLDANGYGNSISMISGIEYSMDPDDNPLTNDAVNIISMSISGNGSPTDPMSIAVDNAVNAGIFCAIAAGNNGPKYFTVKSPGCAKEATCVAASNDQDTIASFSSRGPVLSDFSFKPDICAPGVSIYSSMPGNTYQDMNGTSMATPHVAGAAALILGTRPNLSPKAVKSLLMQTATQINPDMMYQGAGRMNIGKAMRTNTYTLPSSVDFGRIDNSQTNWTKTDSFRLYNISNAARAYTLTVSSNMSAGFTPTLSRTTVTVPTGGDTLIYFTANINNNLLPYPANNAPAYSGYVTATSSTDTIKIPFNLIKTKMLNIHYLDGAPWITYIHNRKDFSIFVDNIEENMSFAVPNDTFVIISRYITNPIAEELIIKENLIVNNNNFDINISSSEANVELFINGFDIDSNKLNLKMGAQVLMSGNFGLSYWGGIKPKTLTNLFSNKHQLSYIMMNESTKFSNSPGMYNKSESYEIKGYFEGISGTTGFTAYPSTYLNEKEYLEYPFLNNDTLQIAHVYLVHDGFGLAISINYPNEPLELNQFFASNNKFISYHFVNQFYRNIFATHTPYKMLYNNQITHSGTWTIADTLYQNSNKEQVLFNNRFPEQFKTIMDNSVGAVNIQNSWFTNLISKDCYGNVIRDSIDIILRNSQNLMVDSVRYDFSLLSSYNIGVTDGEYNLELIKRNKKLAGIASVSKAKLKFNTNLNDKNPPVISMLNLKKNSNTDFSDTFYTTDTIKISANISDESTLNSATVYYKLSNNQTWNSAVTSLLNNKIIANFSIPIIGIYDLKIVVSDTYNNETSFEYYPGIRIIDYNNYLTAVALDSIYNNSIGEKYAAIRFIDTIGLNNDEIEYGICWNTSGNPTINSTNNKYINYFSNAPRNLELEMKKLNPSTTYFVRAFVKRGNLINYSNEVQFTTKPFSAWTWKNPYPQSANLVDVAVLGQERIMAVTDVGSLVYSLDSGNTWKIKNLVDNEFYGMKFTNTLNGWVCGRDGTILRTTDAGETWNPQNAGNYDLYNVFALTDSIAWTYGQGGRIYKTTNSGAAWINQRSVNVESITDVSFYNANVGYAIVGGSTNYIIKTVNGGTNWSQIYSNANYNFTKIKVLNANNVLAFTGNSRIFKSIDAGDSWQLINENMPIATISKVNFLTDSIGFYVTYNGTINKTTDAGTSWTEMADYSYMNALRGIDFSNNTGYAVGHNGAIYKSSNIGNNWSNVSSGYNQQLKTAHFFDLNNALVASTQQQVIKTTDAGYTWNNTNMINYWQINAFSFISNTIGWLVDGVGNIAKTTDAGNNWNNQRTSWNSNYCLNDIKFINQNRGFAVGNSGCVFRTSNGGNQWDSLNINPNYTLRKLAVIDSNTVFIVGTNQWTNYVFVKTTNGGNTWTSITLPNSEDINNLASIFFLDNNIGYIGGSNGKIYKTNNSGTTWTLYQTGLTEQINNILFLSENEGWLAANKSIYYTANGGQTWEKQQLPGSNYIQNLYFQNSNTGWAIGDGGMILKYKGNNDTVPAPVLVAPANLSQQNQPVNLIWRKVSVAQNYRLQISRFSDFRSLDFNILTADTTYNLNNLVANTTYYWRVLAKNAEIYSNWSVAWSFNSGTQSGFSLSGTVKYSNTAQTAINNCIVIVKNSSNVEIASDTTDASGAYSLSGIANGTYTIEVLTTKIPGGLNTTDLLSMRQRIGGTVTYTTLQNKAGDINNNGSIATTDLLPLRLKISNAASNPAWLVPNYVYDPLTVTINGANVELNIQALCGGDVNGSFTPAN